MLSKLRLITFARLARIFCRQTERELLFFGDHTSRLPIITKLCPAAVGLGGSTYLDGVFIFLASVHQLDTRY